MTTPIDFKRPPSPEPDGRRRQSAIVAFVGLALGLLAAGTLLTACGVITGSSEGDGAIYIEYVGNPSGVYDAVCDPVSEPPPGRIVELETLREVNVIDATYEYLPDGLEILDSTAPERFADCRDYDVTPVVSAPAATDATGTSVDETTTTLAATTSTTTVSTP